MVTRRLSPLRALELLEAAYPGRVDLTITPRGPDAGPPWVGLVRALNRPGTIGWTDAATSEPKPSADEARADAVIAFLAEVAAEARGDAELDGLEDVACNEAAARAVLGRELRADTPGGWAFLTAALFAFDNAYESTGPEADEETSQRAGWRAFVTFLVFGGDHQ